MKQLYFDQFPFSRLSILLHGTAMFTQSFEHLLVFFGRLAVIIFEQFCAQPSPGTV